MARVPLIVLCGLLLVAAAGCGGKPLADPNAIYLDAATPETTRASLDVMLETLGHVESFRLKKVLQDFRERIVVAYAYEDDQNPGYPHALWRELQPFDGMPASRLAEELPNAPIQGPSVEESAARMRAASTARLQALYAPFAAYAEAHGGAFPPAVPVEAALIEGDTQGGRFFEAAALYPVYLENPLLLVSPAHPQAGALIERLEVALVDEDMAFRLHTIEAVGGDCYWYFGVALTGVDEAAAFTRALNGEEAHAFAPLRIDGPGAPQTPLLLERPGLQLDGALPALFADGTVRVVPLGEWPNTVAFQKAVYAHLPAQH